MRFTSILATLIFAGRLSLAHAAEIPSADVVKAQISANHAKLQHLHIKATNTLFFTEAYREYNRQLANEEQLQIEALSKLPADQILHANGTTAGFLVHYLTEQEQIHRSSAEAIPPRPTYSHFEFFLSGENYQARSWWGKKKDFQFPDSKPKAANLVTDFDGVTIHSWSSNASPHATLWGGSIKEPVRRFDSHFHRDLPPFLFSIQPAFESGWAFSHPYDLLQDRMIRSMEIVGFEKIEDQDVLVIHAVAETDRDESYQLPNNKTGKRKQQFFLRAWLDLEHGTVPRQMEIWNWAADAVVDKSEVMSKSPPGFAVSTQEILTLENGGFYPSKTVVEHLQGSPESLAAEHDRLAPKITARHFVRHAETWSVELVEAIQPIEETFFVLEFPKEARLWDEKLQRFAKSLEPQRPISPGTPAPKLKVSRWLDGKKHKLEDFKGQLVVLAFWRDDSSSTKSFIPYLVELQKRYQGKPVNFVSIHSAEADSKKLRQKIDVFTSEQNWNYLAAIDSGSMFENSVTTTAYGVYSSPTVIVVSPQGDVLHNDMLPPPEFAHLEGKDEVTPDEETALWAYTQKYYEDAGEVWPGADNVTDEMSQRVRLFYLIKEIDKALAK
jgi:thiol-disulfide isomerase/thioredoxin